MVNGEHSYSQNAHFKELRNHHSETYEIEEDLPNLKLVILTSVLLALKHEHTTCI